METNIKLKEIKINSSIKKYELKTTLLGYGNKGLPGKDGINGENGATFTPSVDNEGNLSWTNDGNLDNPETKNIKGPKGDVGPKGDTGEGVPSGGTTGQVLKKKSNIDYDTEWVNESGGGSGLPSGGTLGQILRKNSAADGDASWSNDTFIPLEPTTVEPLRKEYDLLLVPTGQYYITEDGYPYWGTQALTGRDVSWRKGTLLFIKTFQQDIYMEDSITSIPCNCSHIFVVNKYDYYSDFSLGDAVMYNIFGFKQISGDKAGVISYKMATFTNGGGSGGTSDYTDLTNKPKINNVELSGNKSLSDLGITNFSGDYNDLSNKPTIPTKTSDLTNDSGFLTNSIVELQGTDDNPVDLNTLEAGYYKIYGRYTHGNATYTQASNKSTTFLVGSFGQYSKENYKLIIECDGSNINYISIHNQGNNKYYSKMGSVQEALISGTNIKTINNESILGSGNLAIAGGAEIPIGSTPPENPKEGDFWIDTSANGETYGDTLPIGAMVEYNGTTVPQGYEKVEDKVVTLYENTDGTTGDVSLSKSITNYDYLDIVYGDNTRKMVQRIATNSTIFNLSRQIVDNSKNVFYRNTQYTLSSNSISVQYFNAYTIYSANNNISFETLTASGVTIYKVIGYKEV